MADDDGTPVKSCRTCPSRLSADEAGDFFKKSIGSPMCAKFGHVLGQPGLKPQQERFLDEHFARDCDDHEAPRPTRVPTVLQAQVAVADHTVVSQPPPTEEERKHVRSCLNCAHYITPEVVLEDLGWGAGLCAAKGKLLLGNRLRFEAEECGYRKMASSPRRSTMNMPLLPVYTDALEYDPSPVAAFLARGGKPLIDPSVYPTDREVDADEKSCGVRAWRRVENPNDPSKYTFLPVFDREYFPPEEQAKIPATGDDEHPEWYIDPSDLVYAISVAWMELDETPALWGKAGVGKTELARHLAWIMQCPFDRYSMTRTTDVEDLIGKMLLVNNETSFQWGRLPHRWTKPGVFLLDEPNVGPDECWQRVRPLTDNSKQLVLDEAGGEMLARNPYCFFLMAMNPAWDSKNIGTNEISDADGSRLSHHYMDLPDEQVERGILTQWARSVDYEIPKDILDTVMAITQDIRAMVDDDTLPISWGIRHNIKVVKHLRWFDWHTAYRRAAADKEEPSVAKMILDCVEAQIT